MLASVLPKKANWDLRRDVEQKMVKTSVFRVWCLGFRV
jgi:hypothetical protein